MFTAMKRQSTEQWIGKRQDTVVTSHSKRYCSWVNEENSSKWQWNTLPQLQHLPSWRFSILCWTRAEQAASALEFGPLQSGLDQMNSKGPFKPKLFCDSWCFPQEKKGKIIHRLLASSKTVLWIPRDPPVYTKITLCARSELPVFVRQLCTSVSYNEWQHKLNLTLLNDETKNTELVVLFIYIVNPISENLKNTQLL